MFGYIAPDQGRLTDLQKKRYRGFYCGLCHSLLSRYGQAGRLSLSNDMTFLAILTLLGNLIADVLYAVVDPRVRIS